MEVSVPADYAASAAHVVSADLAHRFVAFLDAKPKTVDTYSKAIKQLFFYFQERGITAPTRADILSYRTYLTERGCKPTTVQNYITAAKLFFQWLNDERLYPNIAAHVKGAKLDRDYKHEYLSADQVKLILNSMDRSTVRGRRDYAIFCLMVTGGLRTIEVSRANIGDLAVVRGATILYIQGKGREEKSEFVKVAAPVEAAIRASLKDRRRAEKEEPLFCSASNNSAGERLTTRSISGIIKSALVNSGFNSDKLTAHSLRHTAVTLALLAGRNLDEVQQFARHADISSTQIYNHSLDKDKNGCVAAITGTLF
jgi:integrase/recombinase XerC